MYRKLLILLLLTNINFAQQSLITIGKTDSIRVDSISITGNNVTEKFVILRELTFKEGDIVTGKTLDYNRERVFSLGLFNKVKLNIIDRIKFTELNIDVSESWYIYPLPFLTLRDNTIKRASYGIILLYKNFRGRNETIKGVATFGYNPTFALSYFNPVLHTGSNFMLGFNLIYSKIQNRNLLLESNLDDDFNYKIISTDISLGYRFDLYNKIIAISSYEYYQVPKAIAELTATKTNIDRTLALGLLYSIDTRNLKQFSDNGIYGEAFISHKGFGINNISYNIFSVDFRHYKMLFGNLSGKWRFLYRHAFGSTIPFYKLSLLGDRLNIRGHKFQRREGHNVLLTSFELNYPIIKEWNLSLDLPLLPKQLTSARIALYTNAFLDGGVTYNNNEPLALNRFDSGYGFGLTLLILPYNAFRFEYAFDEYGNGQFIMESGFSF